MTLRALFSRPADFDPYVANAILIILKKRFNIMVQFGKPQYAIEEINIFVKFAYDALQDIGAISLSETRFFNSNISNIISF